MFVNAGLQQQAYPASQAHHQLALVALEMLPQQTAFPQEAGTAPQP